MCAILSWTFLVFTLFEKVIFTACDHRSVASIFGSWRGSYELQNIDIEQNRKAFSENIWRCVWSSITSSLPLSAAIAQLSFTQQTTKKFPAIEDLHSHDYKFQDRESLEHAKTSTKRSIEARAVVVRACQQHDQTIMMSVAVSSEALSMNVLIF